MSLERFGDEGPSVEMVTAALRADRSDLETFVQVLTTTLSDALPRGMVTVRREKSLSDRLAKREGRAVSLTVHVDDIELTLSTSRSGALQGQLSQEVRGVVISRRPVSVEEWARLLAERLADSAQKNAAARDALAKLLGA